MLDDASRRAVIWGALEQMDERLQRVVVLLCGLDGHTAGQRSLAAVGDIIGVGRERIRQLREEAKQQLREMDCVEALAEYG